MTAREYTPADYPMLKGWMKAREMPIPAFEDMPPLGIVVPHVVSVFLVETNIRMGFLDFFMSNPEVSDEDRIEAFDTGIVLIEQLAFKIGIKRICATTAIPKVAAICMRYGYGSDGATYYFFRKPLTGDNYGRAIKFIEPTVNTLSQ